ncbi:LAFA_0F22716g1_1 [Lachancea sp. 'fantastica']|nr:LAFA_0F22716g1_1 [Lachancea sp. 'fantastica']
MHFSETRPDDYERTDFGWDWSRNCFQKNLVGTFDDLGKADLMEIFSKWKQLIVGTELGILVIDECLYEEVEFPRASSHFWKVVLMTATAGTTGMKKVLKFLHLDEDTRVWDFVKSSPLTHSRSYGSNMWRRRTCTTWRLRRSTEHVTKTPGQRL